MELYLARHGDHRIPDPSYKYKTSLTQQSINEIDIVAKTILKSKLESPMIFSSPLPYCYDSAKIIHNQLRKKYKKNSTTTNILLTSDHLLPERNRFEFYKILSNLTFRSSVIVVGHEPYLTRMITDIIYLNSTNNDLNHTLLRKSGLAKLVVHSLTPSIIGELRWLLTPRILKMIN
ncbi:MAG: hypothetical protein R3321_15120 [Nitrososphaeraceae archaeon]|nr:hypothetical protein [Nitrososphaeraceae archaeon]